MNNILSKRIADLTVGEVLDFAELYNQVKFPTMNLESFCNITQQSKRRVYQSLELNDVPAELIVDGLEFRKYRKSPIFYSKEVLKWINSKNPKTDTSTHKSSSQLSDEISKYLGGINQNK